MNKRHAFALGLAALLVVAALLLSPDSLAWIMLSRLSPTASLSASDGNAVTVRESFYNIDNQTYEWDDCAISSEGEYSGNYTGSFNFGKVDNVAVVAESNVVYLQIKIPKRLGKTVNISLSYFTENGARYHFYMGERNESDTVEYSEIGIESDEGKTLFGYLSEIETGFNGEGERVHDPMPFISYTCTVSEAEETVPSEFNGESLSVTDAPGDGFTLHYDGEGEDGYYYVYIRLVPNLEAYVESVNYIFDYMPCIIDFNLTMSYTVIG